MVMNVGKGRGRVLVAHAVNAEMTGFKNHRFQAGIVAGFGDPFHLAYVVYIDCIEITGLLTLCRCVGQTHRDGMSIQAGNRRLFAAGEVHQRQVIGRSCFYGGFGLGRTQRIHLICPENDVPSSGGGIQLLQSIQPDINRNQMVYCYGKLPDVFFNQQIQCLRLDGHVKRGLACRRGDGNGNGNPVLCGAVLFRILFGLVDGGLDRAIIHCRIAVFIRLYGFGFTGDRGLRLFLRLVGVIIVAGTAGG